MARKTRTREHIIADYSGIHFEKQALDCGYSVERILHDYGIDMFLFTYNENGELENEAVRIQLKATDHLSVKQDGNTISLQVESVDLEAWQKELMPVILVIYDAQKELAYWLHVQDYLKHADLDLASVQKPTVHFDVAKQLDAPAVKQFAQWKNEAHEKLWKLVTKDG